MAKGRSDDRRSGSGKGPDPDGSGEAERQRIDKWLWFARVVKTRSLAAELVESGHVRVNGRRTDAPGKPVRPGDVLTIALDRSIRVLRVLGAGTRRGPFEEARLLYDDLSASSAPPDPDDNAGN